MNFEQRFHSQSKVQTSAPGRVNLLGDHTDYNDGFVLPTATPQRTIVELGESPDCWHHFYSENLQQQLQFNLTSSVPAEFARYCFGCLKVLEQQNMAIPFLNGWIYSTVPIGSGLSSSAALEIALLRSLRSLLNLNLDDVQIAQLGQQAEIQYAGVACGVMDQMAASLADTDHLLFLDTRTLDRQMLPLSSGAEILVLDSGIRRALSTSGYNQRRAESEAAAHQLGVPALRDVGDLQQLDGLPVLLQKRARHVVTENHRVLAAKAGVSAQEFGALMNASHASLRDDYEVSVPDLDCLVDLLQNTNGVFGARLTGAGFGGACVALVEKGRANAIAGSVLSVYNQSGRIGKQLVPA